MGYKAEPITTPQIEQAIHLIRGQRVLLDRDLAALYGVTTGNLNKAVRRNLRRFPGDFMFQLTVDEASRFQIGSSKRELMMPPETPHKEIGFHVKESTVPYRVKPRRKHG